MKEINPDSYVILWLSWLNLKSAVQGALSMRWPLKWFYPVGLSNFLIGLYYRSVAPKFQVFFVDSIGQVERDQITIIVENARQDPQTMFLQNCMGIVIPKRFTRWFWLLKIPGFLTKLDLHYIKPASGRKP